MDVAAKIQIQEQREIVLFLIKIFFLRIGRDGVHSFVIQF